MPLIPMPPSRAEWLQLRQSRLGASEIAALYDAQPDHALSHYALWHVKSGRAPAPEVDGSRVRWGLKLEEVIALAAAEENDWTVTRGHYAICDDEPGLAASLDFEIAADPTGRFEGPGVLETKNADWLAHRRSWTDGEPPIHILLQLQAQMAASGFSWGVVAALVGGNDLRTYPYAARPDLIADIRSRVRDFWRSIEENRPPPVDGSEGASAVLRALHPEVRDDAADMTGSNAWPAAVAAFIAASAQKKAATDAYDEAKNRVAELLGPHRRGYGDGYSVNVTVTPEKPDRKAEPGEIIKGRAESRRYTAKAMERAI